MRNYSLTIIFLTLFYCFSSAQERVNFVIDLTKPLTAISPYIFGTNNNLTGTENWTAFRQGGNRMTGYNWENNASNAGSDWYHNNDNYLTWVMGISSDKEVIPGIVTTTFHENSKNYNAYSLVTLQLGGYAAKDKDGAVNESETAPSTRWVEVKAEKGSSFSLSPDLSDSFIYIDEYVNFLVNKLGNSRNGGIQGYSLDNEPALWPSTHPRIHPSKTLCKEITEKAISVSKAVKNVDSTSEIYGPALYGFAAYTNFQGAPDWNTVSQGKGYTWFIDYYLDEMKKAEVSEGKRLLDVLDVHWYPEAQGDHRITESNATSEADILARVQAPRTLWDESYAEKSWIGQWFQDYLPIIPNLTASINKYYPGTKLAFTEFTYGGENHISGAIAIADVIGIFAKYGIYYASLWPVQEDKSYLSSAYKIYRNYDNSNSTFGDQYAYSTTSDSVNTSVYGSISKSDNEVHIIAINKDFSNNIPCNFQINYDESLSDGKAWYVNEDGADIKQGEDISNISNNSFTYTLTAGSVNHIVLRSNAVSVEDDRVVQKKFELAGFPNPFNASCRLEYFVPHNEQGDIEIYDIMGRRIKSFSKIFGSGNLVWDGTNDNNQPVSSGVYFVKLKGNNQKFIIYKTILMK